MNVPSLEESLRRHVGHLAGCIGERNVYHPSSLAAAEAYISECWQALGFEVESQVYVVKGVPSANLEVTLRGQECGDEIILLGAHYDTVIGCPGANDNASGVAALLELSRLLQKSRLPRTLRFVAFVNEEPPFFYTRQQGSWHYARMARKRGDNIRLMLSLETMGYYCDQPGCQHYPPLFRWFYPAAGNFIAFVSNFRSRPQLIQLFQAFRASSNFPAERLATFAWIPGVAWSDHRSFWHQGYPAVMVTDTAFYRYRCYHCPCDTPEKLDYGRLAEITQGLGGAMKRLAQ